MASEIKVLSWNVNGLKERLKERETLLKVFSGNDEENTVVLLQETHLDETDCDKITGQYDIEKLENNQYKGQLNKNRNTMYLTFFSSAQRGVAILINKPHKCLEAFCEGGDYAWVHVEIDGQKYTFVSVYWHSDDDDQICDLMLKVFNSFLTDESGAFKSRLVIGGDFNTTLSDLDLINQNSAHDARRNRLNRFMSMVQLLDVWREKHGQDSKYTYSCRNPISRLDYIFMLKRDQDCVQSCEICYDIDLSDHFPLSLILKVKETDVEKLTLKLKQSKLS